MFDELLYIKRHREQLAEVTLQACRISLQEIQERLKQAVDKLHTFQLHAKQQEARLYSDLCNKPVRVQAINHALSCVKSWQEQEKSMCNTIHSLEEELNHALVDFNLAREEHLAAQRITEKFIELANIDYNEKALQDERLEEHEMEEVALAMYGKNDWLSHDEVGIS